MKTARPRRLLFALVALLGALLSILGCRPGAPAQGPHGGAPEARPLPTGLRLDPAGRSFDVGNMPLAIAALPGDPNRAVVLLAGWRQQGLQLIDLAAGRVVQTVDQPAAFLGLAFSPDGHTLYASGGNEDALFRYRFQDGALTLLDRIELAEKAEKAEKPKGDEEAEHPLPGRARPVARRDDPLRGRELERFPGGRRSRERPGRRAASHRALPVRGGDRPGRHGLRLGLGRHDGLRLHSWSPGQLRSPRRGRPHPGRPPPLGAPLERRRHPALRRLGLDRPGGGGRHRGTQGEKGAPRSAPRRPGRRVHPRCPRSLARRVAPLRGRGRRQRRRRLRPRRGDGRHRVGPRRRPPGRAPPGRLVPHRSPGEREDPRGGQRQGEGDRPQSGRGGARRPQGGRARLHPGAARRHRHRPPRGPARERPRRPHPAGGPGRPLGPAAPAPQIPALRACRLHPQGEPHLRPGPGRPPGGGRRSGADPLPAPGVAQPPRARRALRPLRPLLRQRRGEHPGALLVDRLLRHRLRREDHPLRLLGPPAGDRGGGDRRARPGVPVESGSRQGALRPRLRRGDDAGPSARTAGPPGRRCGRPSAPTSTPTTPVGTWTSPTSAGPTSGSPTSTAS